MGYQYLQHSKRLGPWLLRQLADWCVDVAGSDGVEILGCQG
jgi:hypothetical protein